MNKTYSRIELIDWVVRNKGDLPQTAHYLAIVLAQNYIDYNGRYRFRHWGEVRIVFSQIEEMTGMSRKTIGRAAKQLVASGMWKYEKGTKGSFSVFTPLMQVSKTASLAPLADEGGLVDEGTAVEATPTPHVEPSSNHVPAPSVPPAPIAPEDDPFGYQRSQAQPPALFQNRTQPQGGDRTLIPIFNRSPEAQAVGIQWNQFHSSKFSIFPSTWHEDARGAHGQSLTGMNNLPAAGREKVRQSIAVLITKGWGKWDIQSFIKDNPVHAGSIQKDYLAVLLPLLRRAYDQDPADYTPMRGAV